MPSGNKGSGFDRRDMLKYLGLTGTAGLAGCTEGPGGNTTTSTTEETTSTTEETTTTEEAQPEVSGSYISGASTDAKTLNVININDVPSDNRVNLTLDGAYTIDYEQNIFPLWADISSDDKQVYEVSLRDNLQWSDPYGQMTAEDWVYTIQNIYQGEENWAGYVNQGDWTDGENFYPVEETGDLTFTIELPSVDPAFPLKPVMWGAYALPKGLLEKYVPDKDAEGLKKDEELNNLSFTGNLGPYTFEKWDRESEFVAVRNEDYYMHDVDDVPDNWQGSSYFEDYSYRVIPEESTRLSALKTGEVTATGIPTNKVKQFEGLDGIDVMQAPQPFNTSLIYNQRANGWEPFREQSVRQALSWVVDKEAIAQQILRGYANVAHTFQPEFSKWFDNSKVQATGVGDRYSVETGRSQLEEALPSGYSYDGDTLVDADGQPVELNLVYGQGSDTTKTTAEFVAQAYGNVGIKVNIKGVQFNTLLSKYAQNTYQGDGEAEYQAGGFNMGNRDEAVSEEQWDLMYGIRFNTYPRTPTATKPFWTRKGSVNFYGYEPDADMVSLYEQAATATDDSNRQQALAEIFGALSEEQPVNFLLFSVDIAGFQSKVEGYEGKFGWGWDSQTWYFDEQ